MELKTVAFYTLGCKVNQYETNAMMQKMSNAGYKIVDFETKAKVYIINTCTVTNMADRKSRQMLRRVKQISPNSILAVVGCYAQVAKQELEQIPEIDLILGTNEKNDVVKYIEEAIKNKKESTYVTDVLHQTEFLDFGDVTYTEKTRAVIKVQDGCNQFCSYCIIPYARGHIRSRFPENIIREITLIAKKGIKEVVITGIHIASYGKDFNEKKLLQILKQNNNKKEYRLIDLLEEIQKIEGIERIRLGSLEPTLITEEFINRLSKLSKICDHFHLSLQSGCNETLKRMNRKYKTEEFKIAVELLRKVYPQVHLTTDIIVGFPGETEEEFNKTYEFLSEINFYKMHIFKYSPRNGTVAAKMSNQIEASIKEQRSNKLIDLSNQNEKNFNQKYLGKLVEVLLEEREGEYLKGHTTNYMVVKIKTEKHLENTIQNVKIDKLEKLELIGKQIENI